MFDAFRRFPGGRARSIPSWTDYLKKAFIRFRFFIQERAILAARVGNFQLPGLRNYSESSTVAVSMPWTHHTSFTKVLTIHTMPSQHALWAAVCLFYMCEGL